jgi:hypothetical protein
MYITFTLKNAAHTFGPLLKTAQSKQLLDGRKFAQSGHPANMLKKEN